MKMNITQRDNMNSLKTKKLEIEIMERPDYKWAVLVPASSVRMGETNR